MEIKESSSFSFNSTFGHQYADEILEVFKNTGYYANDFMGKKVFNLGFWIKKNLY